jgi:hypothetical protein
MTTKQDKHIRWDGAIITAGGFHATDCPCDGCKALAKAQPAEQPQDSMTTKQEIDQSARDGDVLAVETIIRQRDQQERFKWEANKRADKAEQERDQLQRLLAEKNETANVFMNQVKDLQEQVAVAEERARLYEREANGLSDLLSKSRAQVADLLAALKPFAETYEVKFEWLNAARAAIARAEKGVKP